MRERPLGPGSSLARASPRSLVRDTELFLIVGATHASPFCPHRRCRKRARQCLAPTKRMRNPGYALIARVPAECMRAVWPECTRAGTQAQHARAAPGSRIFARAGTPALARPGHAIFALAIFALKYRHICAVGALPRKPHKPAHHGEHGGSLRSLGAAVNARLSRHPHTPRSGRIGAREPGAAVMSRHCGHASHLA
jgi:hypothetical protein